MLNLQATIMGGIYQQTANNETYKDIYIIYIRDVIFIHSQVGY